MPPWTRLVLGLLVIVGDLRCALAVNFDMTQELLSQHGLAQLPASGDIVLDPTLLPGYSAIAASQTSSMRF